MSASPSSVIECSLGTDPVGMRSALLSVAGYTMHLFDSVVVYVSMCVFVCRVAVYNSPMYHMCHTD